MATVENFYLYLLVQIVVFQIITAIVVKSDTYSALDDLRHVDAKNHHLSRHPRDASRRHRKKFASGRFGSALYFDGKGHPLKLRFLTKDGIIALPNEEFTVQFWVKPEGGQSGYTPIIDVFDECDVTGEASWWAVGLGVKGREKKDARFIFSLRAEASASSSHLFAHKQYSPSEWTNVAASYNGRTMSLYVNGAKISLGHEQKGPLYSEELAKCKLLFMGSAFGTQSAYRGKIDEFSLWNRPLSHSDIVNNMYRREDNAKNNQGLLIYDSFDNLDKWRLRGDIAPELVQSDISVSNHHIRFVAPPCGKTVCDDPQLVLSYLNNPQLREDKTIRYRIVNIKNDDGSNPLITEKEMFEQHKALSKAYGDYNIAFEMEEFELKNSSIRQRVIMFECVPYKVGDGHCDEECGHSTTGNDGGDCDRVRTECEEKLLGNGVCDTECNKVYHRYDDGDCCLNGDNAYKTCIDPSSPLRGYLNIEDIKMDLQLDGSHQINVFFITSTWYKDLFRGVATYPWEKNVYTSIGGNIVHMSTFGRTGKLEALVHEFGHNLGLWHVHHGVSESRCDDQCAETHPSMVLGDLCSDTRPTPRNRFCHDPIPTSGHEATCGVYRFVDTPFNNYMSYADDACTDHFTPQQVARMHCYLDLVYQPMREMKTPTPVPLAPKVVRADARSVSLVWLEPLDADSSCDVDNALYQYADVATSSHNGIRWSPQEATGFPDADHCSPSRYAWMPHFSDMPPSCDRKSCWLELGFKTPVIPRRLRIWIADLEEETDLLVELVNTFGRAEEVGTVPAFCDMETSLVVNTDQVVEKIRIYTSTSYVAIDAVEMVSDSNHAMCLRVKYPKYRLVRDPPFPAGHVSSADTEYTDGDVEAGVTYRYHVQTVQGANPSVDSPALTYTHGEPFCGDGLVSQWEECDDKNTFNGDGCSIQCSLEEGFTCKGEPSLCYMHRDDGICEDFERGSTSRDCGHHTPEGYQDQWAARAEANPDHQSPDCPASAITGQPDVFQPCGGSTVFGRAWRPCREHPDVTGDFWVEATIYRPVVAVAVVIYLAADGATAFSPVSKTLNVHLVTSQGDTVALLPADIPISCHSNPVVIPVVQDLSKPFFLTKGVRIRFSYAGVSISAVGVRSSAFLNPVALASCDKSELYNPRHGQCVKQTCAESNCGEFPVKYGVAECTGSSEGDECSIKCDQGYVLDGHDNTAVCVSGDWLFSGPLACSPVDCGRPEVSEATVACPDGTLYAHQCHFKCDRPATLQGTDTSITCLENGAWSKQEAWCEVTCPPVGEELFTNGDLKSTACKRSKHGVGRQCKVKCHEGYHVEMERNKKRYLRLSCGKDGKWVGPRCARNQCPPLPTMFTGAYTCTDGLHSGSTCRMSCPGNLTLFRSITCTTAGEWSGELSLCPVDSSKTCAMPTSSDDIIFDCIDNGVGGKCAVQCRNEGHVATIKVKGHAGSTYVDELDKVECTVMQKWEPDPTKIVCEESCLHWSVGDGICDAINNRALCDWDDGDCCPSTVDDGIVITIPDDCPTDCRCLDPAAPENIARNRRRRFKP